MKKSKKKRTDFSNMRCPYCGSTVVYKSGKEMFKSCPEGVNYYVCTNYPECDTFIKTMPNSNKPIGTLANKELRMLRRDAHSYFNQLYLSGAMSKEEAYLWLANTLGCPKREAHIGQLREYSCKLIIKESQEHFKHCKPQNVRRI